MSDNNTPGYAGEAAYRVLTLRVDEDTRAQLEILAQLNDRKTNAECVAAFQHWIEKSKSDPKVLERAEQVRAEIEREAETKRNAITSVLGASKRPARGKQTESA